MLIVGQIVCMQALFYVALGLALLVVDAAAGAPLTLAQLLFDASEQQQSQTLWWAVPVALFATACACACGLVFVVEKARKCLDFASTAYLLHAAACAAYAGPRALLVWWWWVALVGSAALCAVAGEFLCMRRELRDIPIVSSSSHRSVFAV